MLLVDLGLDERVDLILELIQMEEDVSGFPHYGLVFANVALGLLQIHLNLYFLPQKGRKTHGIDEFPTAVALISSSVIIATGRADPGNESIGQELGARLAVELIHRGRRGEAILVQL